MSRPLPSLAEAVRVWLRIGLVSIYLDKFPHKFGRNDIHSGDEPHFGVEGAVSSYSLNDP